MSNPQWSRVLRVVVPLSELAESSSYLEIRADFSTQNEGLYTIDIDREGHAIQFRRLKCGLVAALVPQSVVQGTAQEAVYTSYPL
uniref:(California timema) hypothetical protein n=1 Tax=Timema californicum TaxID=61474 RepID=A0A7R9J4C2_TIMCA|nr:unnamed protein product [Timema californicum]